MNYKINYTIAKEAVPIEILHFDGPATLSKEKLGTLETVPAIPPIPKKALSVDHETHAVLYNSRPMKNFVGATCATLDEAFSSFLSSIPPYIWRYGDVRYTEHTDGNFSVWMAGVDMEKQDIATM